MAFGGQMGVVFMVHFIAQREKQHSNLLGLHVQRGNGIADGNIRMLTGGLYAKSSELAAAAGRAVTLVQARLQVCTLTVTLVTRYRSPPHRIDLQFTG
jgi:MFS transporter, DHA2 family, multidrug resistance protein